MRYIYRVYLSRFDPFIINFNFYVSVAIMVWRSIVKIEPHSSEAILR